MDIDALLFLLGGGFVTIQMLRALIWLVKAALIKPRISSRRSPVIA